MRQWGHVLLLAAILAVGAWFSLRELTFFTPDTGLRYLQVRTFEENGWGQAAIPYPGLQFDPGMRFVPYYQAFSRYGDNLLIVVSLFFPLAVAAMRTLFGAPGIVVVPVLGTLLAAGSTALLWRQADQRRTRWIFWGTAVATPLLVYSMTLWDHTLGVGLSTAAVYMAARWLDDRRWHWPFFSGALISLAVAQRADIAAMAVSLGLALLVIGWPRWRILITYGFGGLLGLLVTAPFNQLWAGHPLGLAVARPYFGYLDNTYHAHVTYADIEITHAMVATRQLLDVQGGQPLTLIAALLLVSGSIFLALVLRLPPVRRSTPLYLCLALIVAGTVLGMLPARYGSVNGMFTTLPLSGLAFAYVDGRKPGIRVYRLVFLVTWLYVILTLLILRAPGGGQWGGRYLLSAVPLLFFLAMYAVVAYQQQMRSVDARALWRVAVVLVVFSVLIQLAGVRALYMHKAEHKNWQDAIAALPADVVLTNSPFIASFMAGIEDKTFLYVENEADVRLLAQRLAAQKVDRFAWVPVPEEAAVLNMPAQAGPFQIEAETPFVYRLIAPGNRNERQD